MKFTPEVIAALNVLRHAVENDFERHRLDVLIKDLTAPPKVEVIDDAHQKFNGKIYYRYKKGKHYHSSSSIHRDVYTYYYGNILTEYEIHHRDLNPSNNDISNLQPLTCSQHQKIHRHSDTPKKCICEYCGNDFYSTSQVTPRFCSHSCQCSWHYYFGNTKKIIKICPVCKKQFKTHEEKQECCSRICKGILQKKRTAIKYQVPKICEHCKKPFLPSHKNHYKTQRFCSRSCANKSREKNTNSETPKKD